MDEALSSNPTTTKKKKTQKHNIEKETRLKTT
jgi:hypothetical protein